MPHANVQEVASGAAPAIPVQEYSSAAMAFLSDAHEAVMQAHSPVLGRVPRQRVEAIPRTRYALGDEAFHEESPVVGEAPVTIHLEAVRHCDLDALMTLIGEIAFAMGEQLQAQLLEHVGRLSDASGMTVDGAGKDFVDGWIEALERMDLSVDDDGQLVLPTIVTNPATFRKPTPEQTKRLNEVLARKEAEAHARRPNRRLR